MKLHGKSNIKVVLLINSIMIMIGVLGFMLDLLYYSTLSLNDMTGELAIAVVVRKTKNSVCVQIFVFEYSHSNRELRARLKSHEH